MALQGTLDTVPLPDVLSLLASTGKVGRLRVEGAEVEGTLWVADGAVVSADAEGSADPVQVLVSLLRLEEGAFRFDPDEAPRGPLVRRPIDDALAEAAAWLAEWSAIEAVLPSPRHLVRLRPDLGSEGIHLSADVWRAVVEVAGGGVVADLVPRLAAVEIEGARVLVGLVESGLVQVDEPVDGSRARWGGGQVGPVATTDPAPAVVQLSPAPVGGPAGEADDELGTGQPWRDQVRQLLGAGPAEPDPPAPNDPERFGAAQVPRPPEPAAGAPVDGDRDVLLKFLSSVQP